MRTAFYRVLKIKAADVSSFGAEFTGTFLLVFFGTGSIMLGGITGSRSPFTTALAFGSIVTLVSILFARASGGVVNPAMSFGLYLSGSLSGRKAYGFVLSQFAGATAASLVLRTTFGMRYGLGVTKPSTAAIGFTTEVGLAMVLFSAVFISIRYGIAKKLSGAFVAGATVALETLIAGGISGASVNPARSFGPALVSGDLNYLWIYLTAPVIGAAAASYLMKRLPFEKRPDEGTAMDDSIPLGRAA